MTARLRSALTVTPWASIQALIALRTCSETGIPSRSRINCRASSNSSSSLKFVCLSGVMYIHVAPCRQSCQYDDYAHDRALTLEGATS